MTTFLTILAVWFFVQIIAGIALGKHIKNVRRSTTRRA